MKYVKLSIFILLVIAGGIGFWLLLSKSLIPSLQISREPSIIVNSPSGPTVWRVGTSYKIIWDYINANPQTVVGYLEGIQYGGTSFKTQIFQVPAADKSFSYTVQEPLPAVEYTIVICTDLYPVAGGETSCTLTGFNRGWIHIIPSDASAGVLLNEVIQITRYTRGISSPQDQDFLVALNQMSELNNFLRSLPNMSAFARELDNIDIFLREMRARIGKDDQGVSTLLKNIESNILALQNKLFTSALMSNVAPPSQQIRSRDARRIADIKQIQLALNIYLKQYGRYPTSLPELVKSGHIPSVPQDPLGTSSKGVCRPDYCYTSSLDQRTYHLGAYLEQPDTPVLPGKDCNSVRGINCPTSSYRDGFDGSVSGVYDVVP